MTAHNRVRAEDPHADQAVLVDGTDGVTEETRGLLLVHGRGGNAREMLGLGHELSEATSAVLVAPQAARGTWYPGSFLEPLSKNEPWLGSALRKLEGCSTQLVELGIPWDRQVIVGFSQGACLSSELVARSGHSWRGLIAFTGGILGPLGEGRRFEGDLRGTKILLSSGDPDPHVPFSRVEETAVLFESLGADIEVDRYPGRPHTILRIEVERAQRLLA